MVATRWALGLALALCLLFAGLIAWLWPIVGQLADSDRPRSFYIPSEAMLPTLRVNDRVRPRRPLAGEPRRGQVVIVQAASGVRVARVVAIGGDLVAMRDGRLWLNGAAVPLRDLGPGPTLDSAPTRLQRERLPGENGSHRLLDAGPSIGDDHGPVRVPAHRLFLLGDDRDRSADSRYPAEQMGLGGPVPTRDVLGVVDRLLFAPGLRDMGRPIDAAARP